MKRYPIDILSIYRCLCDVGKRHEDYIEVLVPTLLKLDKMFLPKEANVEDQLCKLSVSMYMIAFIVLIFLSILCRYRLCHIDCQCLCL